VEEEEAHKVVEEQKNIEEEAHKAKEEKLNKEEEERSGSSTPGSTKAVSILTSPINPGTL
jgi:hypothetical protein